ncbi:MAG: hypothetical protein ABWX76_11710, partial [Leifsonia flava]
PGPLEPEAAGAAEPRRVLLVVDGRAACDDRTSGDRTSGDRAPGGRTSSGAGRGGRGARAAGPSNP